jgi:ATP-dependent Clp protease adaptor protein ClpS
MIDEDILIEEDTDIDEAISGLFEYQIVVYNDDVNTFEHVIICFMKYCGHEWLQAEQCALIIHNNGKCSVKKGQFNKLKPICEALLENGIKAKIE